MYDGFVLSTDEALAGVLERFWGYSSFRPLQRDAMDAIIAGRDSIVVLPTGGGKSLCFQAPALVRDGVAVVVSPLISLMKDQVDTLVGNGVPAAFINSTLSSDQRRAVTEGVRDGRFRLLYVSPERLVGEGGDSFRNWLSKCNVSFIAVDEAHCISQWGHDFRPEYRQLASLRAQFPAPAFMPSPRPRQRGSGATSRHSSRSRTRSSSWAPSIGRICSIACCRGTA